MIEIAMITTEDLSTRLRTVCSDFLLNHVIIFIQCRNYGRTFLKFTLCGKKFSRQYRNRTQKGRRHYTTGKVVCTCVSDFQLMLHPYLHTKFHLNQILYIG